MSFLLAHRSHIRHGDVPVLFDRVIVHEGQHFKVRLRSRGYRYELTPPVPVDVLEGRIRGRLKKAIRGLRPLREQLVQAAVSAAEGSSPTQPSP